MTAESPKGEDGVAMSEKVETREARCPKCGASVEMDWNTEAEYAVECSNGHGFDVQSIEDFAQFFPAPAPGSTPEKGEPCDCNPRYPGLPGKLCLACGRPFAAAQPSSPPAMTLNDILYAAYKFDDKPHQLFSAIRTAARGHENETEIVRLMDKAYAATDDSLPSVEQIAEFLWARINFDMQDCTEIAEHVLDCLRTYKPILGEENK